MCSAPFLLHLINGSCGSVMVHADRLASLEAMTTGSWLILGGNVLIFQKRCTRSCTKQRIIPAYRNARRGDFGLVVQLNWSKKNSYASNFPFRFTSTSFEHLTADKPRLNSRGSDSGLLDSGGQPWYDRYTFHARLPHCCKRRKNNRNNQPHCKTKLSTALRAPEADKASVLRIWAQFSKFASNRARIWSRLAFLGLLSSRRLAAKARSALAGRSSFFTL